MLWVQDSMDSFSTVSILAVFTTHFRPVLASSTAALKSIPFPLLGFWRSIVSRIVLSLMSWLGWSPSCGWCSWWWWWCSPPLSYPGSKFEEVTPTSIRITHHWKVNHHKYHSAVETHTTSYPVCVHGDRFLSTVRPPTTQMRIKHRCRCAYPGWLQEGSMEHLHIIAGNYITWLIS